MAPYFGMGLWRVLGVLGFVAMSLVVTSVEAAEDVSNLFDQLSPSVWTVLVQTANGGGQLGSAVVIGDGMLVTNCHVLRNGTSIVVYRREEKKKHVAHLVYPDVQRDLCIMRADDLHAPAVTIAPIATVRVGQHVIAIGSPVGLENTLSDGLVSALIHDTNGNLVAIQTSAPISHGSSGGGLFDASGRLIGITSAGVDAAKGENLNFAWPANWIAEVPKRGAAQLGSNAGAAAIGPFTPPVIHPQAPTIEPPPIFRPAPPSAASPVPSIDRPVPDSPTVSSSPQSDQLRTYQTTRDTAVRLSAHASIDRDCRVIGVPDIRIVAPPQHGRLDFREGDYLMGTLAKNPIGVDCSHRPAHGTLIDYVPNPGYSGDDTARYEVTGKRYHYIRDVRIHVQNNTTGPVGTNDTPANPQPIKSTFDGAYDARWARDACVRPVLVYPEDAVRQSMQGKVELDVRLDGLSHAQVLRVARSSGAPLLDAAATKAFAAMACPSDGIVRIGHQTILFASLESQDNRAIALANGSFGSFLVRKSSKLSCHIPQPDYAKAAIKANEQGTVSSTVYLASDGRILNFILWGSGSDPLDSAVAGALSTSWCDPYEGEGKGMRLKTAMDFRFRIED